MTKVYKGFFAGHQILIADDSSVSRVSIARCLTELGASSTSITLAETFEVAQLLIATKSFSMVVCEYDLGGSCGIDLLKTANRGSKLALSAVITKSQSEVAAAVAAENDVDIFLRKPFSMDALKNAFESIIIERPVEDAIDRFKHIQDRKLVYDKTGYRALVQLFESLMSEGNKVDAYRVLQRLVTTYPVHPDRLSAALRLAVETRNFNDVDSYYSFFVKIEPKGDDLVRHVYAALVSSGKAALRAGDLQCALKRFKEAAKTSGKRSSVLREIILELANGGYHAEADAFLSAFPQHERQSIDFLTLDYFVMSKSQPIHLILQRGRELIRSGHAHPVIYEILIKASKNAGHHSEAESLSLDAKRRWPTVNDDAKSDIDLPTA